MDERLERIKADLTNPKQRPPPVAPAPPNCSEWGRSIFPPPPHPHSTRALSLATIIPETSGVLAVAVVFP